MALEHVIMIIVNYLEKKSFGLLDPQPVFSFSLADL